MSKARLDAIDMTRGVSILLVAAFHANTTEPINLYFADLRMPLFFLLSGFLFSHKYIVSPQLLLKSRVKSLLLPYFTAATLFYLFWVLRTLIDPDEAFYLRTFFGIFYGISPDDWLVFNMPLWFLVCLFCTQIIFVFSMKILQKVKDYIQVLVFIVISCLGIVIGKIVYLPWSFDVAMSCQIFVFVGYKIKQYGLIHKFKPISLFTLILVAIYVLAAYFNGIVDVGFRLYSNILLFFIAGITGSIAVLKLVSLFTSIKWISKGLSYIGRESLPILIFHGGLFIYATGVLTNRLGINIHWTLAWIISIVGSLLLAELIKRNSILNFWFNGRTTNKKVEKPLGIAI